MFRSVIDEVFMRSHAYCTLYVPKVGEPQSEYDPLYGEVKVEGLVYYRARLRCMAQVVQNDYEISEKGTVLLYPAIEFTFRTIDIENFYRRVGLASGARDINFVGVIIEFGGIYYEVTQDVEDVYLFNEREPEFLKVTVQATSAIDTRGKLKISKIRDVIL